MKTPSLGGAEHAMVTSGTTETCSPHMRPSRRRYSQNNRQQLAVTAGQAGKRIIDVQSLCHMVQPCTGDTCAHKLNITEYDTQL
jgi:hypothetical protein